VISRQQKVSIVHFASPGHCRCANRDGRTIPRSRNRVPGLCLVIHPVQTADVSLHREGSFTIRFGSSNGKQSKRRTGVQSSHKCARGQTLFGRVAFSKQMVIRFLSSALRPLERQNPDHCWSVLSGHGFRAESVQIYLQPKCICAIDCRGLAVTR
jgi:hypothetical protein